MFRKNSPPWYGLSVCKTVSHHRHPKKAVSQTRTGPMMVACQWYTVQNIGVSWSSKAHAQTHCRRPLDQRCNWMAGLSADLPIPATNQISNCFALARLITRILMPDGTR
jgi:hypothetical protein